VPTNGRHLPEVRRLINHPAVTRVMDAADQSSGRNQGDGRGWSIIRP